MILIEKMQMNSPLEGRRIANTHVTLASPPPGKRHSFETEELDMKWLAWVPVLGGC
jgi:hypothetical protein